MELGYMKKLCLVLLVQIAVIALTAPAMAVTYNLRADRTTITLPGPDGNPVSVPVWGFANDTAGATNIGVVMVPGPQLNVTAGDTLTINLVNNLPVPVSLVIPGQGIVPNTNPPAATNYDSSVPAMNIPQNPYFPIPALPISPTPRVRSFTTEAAARGGTAVYNFGVVKTGTFVYESGTNPALQIPMGLYGALVVGPGSGVAGAAYPPTLTNPNTTYDRDQVLLFSEIQARYDFTLNKFATMNEDVDRNTCTTGATDLTTCTTWKTTLPYPLTTTATGAIKSTLDYEPLYYMINGKSYPDTIAPQPVSATPGAPTVPGIYAPFGTAGKTLLRMINAGGKNRVPTIQGSYQDNVDPLLTKPHAIYPQPIAEDGNLYPYPKQEFAPILPAGKTLDVMLNLTAAAQPGYYTLYDRTLGLTNAGKFPGGMLTFLASWDPAVTDCSPFKGDLNGDGRIDGRDALLALQAVVFNTYNAAGDVTPLNNGLPCGVGPAKTALTMADALFILQKAIGMNPY